VPIRVPRRVRSTIVGVAAAAALAVGVPALATPAPRANPPAPANPSTIDSVQKQLGALTEQNDQLVDKYDQAQSDLALKQKAAAAAKVVANRAQASYLIAKREFSAAVTAQYENGTFTSAGALLSSRNGESYLDEMAAMALLSDHTAQVVNQYQTRKAAATAAAGHANQLVSAAAETLASVNAQRAHVKTQIAKYTALLNKLNAEQRRAYLMITNPSVHGASLAAAKLVASNAGSKAARIAVQFALNQVGKPYVFGSAGPDSYDCSGLTMRAWGAAGVRLPHSAAGQYNYGTHVPATVASLQPGDLIFFYQPIGHVTIYIGGGLMVSAPTSGENVMVVPLSAFSDDITGATRLT
jgi:cell wall-associated NlpC family hydrolase